MIEARRERARRANALLQVIGTTERRFFSYAGRVSWLEVDERGRVWWNDSWRGGRIYLNRKPPWSGFHNGGTLQDLVRCLRDYVMRGDLLPEGVLGPWPESTCGGDLWGYGWEAMDLIRRVAASLGIAPRKFPCAIGSACLGCATCAPSGYANSLNNSGDLVDNEAGPSRAPTRDGP